MAVGGKKISDNDFTYGMYKYTKLAPITFEQILMYIGENGACDELVSEFKKIVIAYGILFGETMSFKDIMAIAVKESKWLDWLLENDFIEKDVSKH